MTALADVSFPEAGGQVMVQVYALDRASHRAFATVAVPMSCGGQDACHGACVDLRTDHSNCGACGIGTAALNCPAAVPGTSLQG